MKRLSTTLKLAAALAALAVAGSAAPMASALPRAVPAQLNADDQALVAKAGDYLQGLTSAKGRFTQISPSGASSQGEVFLARPGKARFAYGSPPSLLIVSDGKSVSVYDRRLKTFNRYPLGSTPLSLFLGRDLSLRQGVIVTGVTHAADGFTLVLRDAKHQAQGQISLSFSDRPVALREWAVTDARGATTRVRITELDRGGPLDPNLFVLRDPRPASAQRPPVM